VVGGGPAGLTAAIESAGAGADTVLLEGGPEPGRKLLLTGEGRCNLTNNLDVEDFIAAYGTAGKFLRNAFSRFFSRELLAYLGRLGVETALERGGRYYPCREGAGGVLAALIRGAQKAGVRIERNRRVTGVTTKGGIFLVRCEGYSLKARSVVVATGGASYPWTGSRGDGYGLAEQLGHTVSPLVPALVPVRCSDAVVPRLAGLRLKNVNLTADLQGKKRSAFGEVHFTDFGISGPAVFPVSKHIARAARDAPVPLSIDFKPALDEKKLETRILREINSAGRSSMGSLLERLLPLQAVDPLLSLAGLNRSSSSELSREQRRKVVRLLKGLPLTATGTLPLAKAMVTAGGVRLKEIDPGTMESRIVPGLFFCGEVLDLDGTTGGFNLQAAFTTGYLGGQAAAEAAGRE
jgi:predicted Rossmann fold flavoprotein